MINFSSRSHVFPGQDADVMEYKILVVHINMLNWETNTEAVHKTEMSRLFHTDPSI